MSAVVRDKYLTYQAEGMFDRYVPGDCTEPQIRLEIQGQRLWVGKLIYVMAIVTANGIAGMTT